MNLLRSFWHFALIFHLCCSQLIQNLTFVTVIQLIYRLSFDFNFNSLTLSSLGDSTTAPEKLTTEGGP